MKLLFVILDGAGDVKIKGKTALEAARIKNMNRISAASKTGMLYPIKDVAPESDEAVLSLLGYDPFKYYPGRGPVEALGIGLKFHGMAVRGDFSLVKKGILKEPAARISDREAKNLCAILNRKISIPGVKFIHSKGYRFVLLLSLKGLSDKIQSTHPGYRVFKNHVTGATRERFNAKPKRCVPLTKNPSAVRTAKLVNEITKKAEAILSKEKANYILLRGAGTRPLKTRKLKGKWVMFADSPADKGIGKALGMHVLPKPDSNKKLADAVIKNMKKFNNFFVQIKSPDKYSHLMEYKNKVKALGLIDREFFGYLEKKTVLKKFFIVLTADHSTSSLIGTHLKNPVPIAISSSKPDKVKRFGEKYCSRGSLKKINGPELMKIVEHNMRDAE